MHVNHAHCYASTLQQSPSDFLHKSSKLTFLEKKLHRKTCSWDSRYRLKSRLASDWLALAGDGACWLAAETDAVSVEVPRAALWWRSRERASFAELRRLSANIFTYTPQNICILHVSLCAHMDPQVLYGQFQWTLLKMTCRISQSTASMFCM